MMRLSVRAPTELVVEASASKVVAEGPHGLFCLLPRHVDLATLLVPGLLAFVDEGGAERFVAVDRGLLVKRGPEVLVAALRAVGSTDLDELERTVAEVYLREGDAALRVHATLARLELGFRRRLGEVGEGALS